MYISHLAAIPIELHSTRMSRRKHHGRRTRPLQGLPYLQEAPHSGTQPWTLLPRRIYTDEDWIQCDLQHLKQPACGPCAKSKRVCRFPQNHIFVNHEEGTHKTVYRKADGERDRADPPLLVQWSEDRTGNFSRNGTGLRILNRLEDPVPDSIPATALVRQQFLANARSDICSGRQDDADFPQFWSAAITSQTLDSWACRTSPALACYTAWMGRQNDDPCLVEASRRLYVQGLREVQQSVNDPEKVLLDETLSACIGLIIYEALECPDRSYSAYHKHIDGCSALIKLRGIDAHIDGAGHDLFRGFRYIAVRIGPSPVIASSSQYPQVIKALQDHQGSYLSDPLWSEIPFSIHPKDPHDRLLDILATGASFLGESDRFASTPPSGILTALLHMDDRLLDLDARLEALYAELELAQNGSLYWSTTPSLRSFDDEPEHTEHRESFTSPISFPDQDTARLLTLYWAQQTLLRMGRAEVRTALAGMAAAGLVSGHAERVNRSLSQPPKPQIESAHLVLRSRDFCCSSPSTLLRYSVPLNITLDVLANRPEMFAEEIRFAKEVKRQISQRHLRITQYTGTLKHVKDV